MLGELPKLPKMLDWILPASSASSLFYSVYRLVGALFSVYSVLPFII